MNGNIENGNKKRFHVLFVGNSFSDDTSEYLSDIAASFGIEDIRIGVLFYGACSINMHISHIEENKAVYLYFLDRGNGWKSMPNYTVREAVESDEWDYVIFQGGTGDGSRSTEISSYDKLPQLIEMIREMGARDAKLVYNMTWVGEPTHKHPHILAFGGDVELMFSKIISVMKQLPEKVEALDLISPTGMAIQNARSSTYDKKFTRDGYHLSFGMGRFIASLTLFAATTGFDVRDNTWFPHGFSEYECKLCVESAYNAIKSPYSKTQSEY